MFNSRDDYAILFLDLTKVLQAISIVLLIISLVEGGGIGLVHLTGGHIMQFRRTAKFLHKHCVTPSALLPLNCRLASSMLFESVLHLYDVLG